MNKKQLVLVLLLSVSISLGQDLEWDEISDNYNLPQSVKVFEAERNQPVLKIYYIDLDLNDENIVVRPYLSSSNATVKSLADKFGAYAAINGGYFWEGISYSAVIYPDKVKARNVGALTRNGKSYPVIRSLFSLSDSFLPSVVWIYHFSGGIDGIYSFESPLAYTYNDTQPLLAPDQSDGTRMDSLLTGIGGGPTLVKNGEKHVTYNEEIFWGSGVGLDKNDPRTAVGYTQDDHVILITADGRQAASEGVGLNELAEIMIDLGCVEAMNLDGGGSSQMAVPGEFINSPSENRAVPSILAVTHRDSLYSSDTSGYHQIIDTEDEQCNIIGDWFETANAGYWGSTPSQLSQKGSGQDILTYDLNLNEKKTFEIYAWWVAANNRCKDTPYVIVWERSRDTVRVDQTKNNATWNYLGEYNFSPGRDSIIISDAATSGTYVVADAIALKTVETSLIPERGVPDRVNFTMVKNFPNPFNNQTKIQFKINRSSRVDLTIYNMAGQLIESIFESRNFHPGIHRVDFNSTGLASGIYFYELSSQNSTVHQKMLLIK